MGVWNSHTSVGNILGSVIAAKFVQTAWGWSFVIPGIIIGSMGVLCLLALVEGIFLLNPIVFIVGFMIVRISEPADVDCELPVHEVVDTTGYERLPTSEHVRFA